MIETMLLDDYRLLPFRAEFGLATVLMWRASFQSAMGLPAGDSWGEVCDQLAYLMAMDAGKVRVVLHEASSEVAALFVASAGEVDHLYVARSHQGRGLGTHLLNIAKQESSGVLELHTFARNTGARRFYRRHGFQEVETGRAAMADNPWASSPDQLNDVRCRWRRDGVHD
ncbi:MAG: GNAT family N-acetyltransferase [Pseudomonadaceae bacterium]|nr:GNAT family N-acetyltransferase [Pseudomonadaceae bacterium]